MLISFSVGNFRSFCEEQTLSLVASKKLSSHANHLFPIPGTRQHVLRMAVMYGANGAGKSNLFKALKFAKSIATGTRTKSASTGRDAFRFPSQSDAPSSFDLQFISEGAVYRYGFKAGDSSIEEEWLVKIKGSRERVLYERLTEPGGKVVISAPGFKVSDKISLMATIGGPQNQSFLATVVATIDYSEINSDIRAVVDWFNLHLNLIGPRDPIEPIGHTLSTDAEFLHFAGDFLKSSSTGVEKLNVEKVEISEEEIGKLLPNSMKEKLLSDLESSGEGMAIVSLGKDIELLIERKDANQFYRISIQATHKTSANYVGNLDLSEESDGTRRLLQLMPVLHRAKTDNEIYFVDEIDRSMHPMLIWKFLESFVRSCCGQGSQLIVTTHESNLLDLELFRRDEIFFVEKSDSLATQIYSLMDFKVRKDLEIRKHYLQGRFGAVPFLGNVDRLVEQETAK